MACFPDPPLSGVADEAPADLPGGDAVTVRKPACLRPRTTGAKRRSVRQGRDLRVSFAWAGAESFVNILAALSMTLLVGRIIGPVEFGLAAIAYLFGSLAEVVVITPFADPLIQRRRFDVAVVDAAFSAMVAVGAGVYLLILIAAPLLARLYDKPMLTALLAVQGTTCLFAGLRGCPEAILARKLRFRALSIRNIVAKTAGAAMSVTAALLGMGAWSIILGNVAFAASATVMIWAIMPRRPRLVYHPGHVSALFAFGRFSLLDALLWTATPRLFSFSVGYFQGIRVLGELNIAFRINDTVCALILAVTTRIALPMFSRVAEDIGRLEQAFLQGTRMVNLIVAPAFLGVAFASPEIVDLALGAEWHLAWSALTAACLFSLFNFARVLAHSTVKAVARPALLIGPNVVGLIYIGAGSYLLRRFGFDAQLALWVSFGIVFVLCSLRMIRKAIGTDWLTQLKPLRSAALPSLGMCAVLYGVIALHPAASDLGMLLLKVTLGGLSYALLLVALQRPLLLQMLGRPARAGG